MKSLDKPTQVSDKHKFTEIVQVPIQPDECSKEKIYTYIKVPKFAAKAHDAVCNAGLPEFKDMYIKGFLGKVSLGTLLAELQKLKKEFYEQIRAFITTYLPDGIRPIKLAVDVARQLRYYREIIECTIQVVTNIRKLLEDYLNEINEFLTDLNYMFDRLRTELFYIVQEIKNIPKETQLVIFGTLVEQLHIEDAFELINEVKKFEESLDALSNEVNIITDMLQQWPDKTMDQLKLIAEENGLDDVLRILNDNDQTVAYNLIVDLCDNKKTEVETGQQALSELRKNEDYANAEFLKEELEQSIQTANDLKNSVQMPEMPENDLQELIDYQEEILDSLTDDDSGGSIITGGSMQYLIDKLAVMEQKKVVDSTGEIVPSDDNFFRYWFTNNNSITDDDIKNYTKVYHPFDGFDAFEQGGEFELINIEGPGVVFPDIDGFAKILMHTDEPLMQRVRVTIKRDGKVLVDKYIHGYGATGKRMDVVKVPPAGPFPPHYEHFMQEIVIKPLVGENGQIFPILFKENFSITISKDNNIPFSHDFDAYIGCKYIKLIKEAI